MTLEQRLAKVYAAMKGRNESDIGMSDPYWKILQEFRLARAQENNRPVDSAEAKQLAGIEESIPELPVVDAIDLDTIDKLDTSDEPEGKNKTKSAEEQLKELGLL